MNDADKRKARDDLRSVEQVLWDVWDPIGVNSAGAPRDEYDSYAPGVMRLLLAGATEDVLVAHLQALEADLLGMDADTTARETAIALLQLKLI
jgi:hypothetical protein